MEQYYLALIPEKKLTHLINQQKKLIEKEIGNQTYLHHPPHITLIIFTADNLNDLIKELENSKKEIKKPKIKINNFYIFYNDIFTKNNTITYFLDENNLPEIKKIQLKIINSIDKFNTRKFISEQDESYKKMSDIEKQNIEKYGFPFVNENWIPHITIASIEPSQFEFVFNKLKQSPIKGEFFIKSINLYKVGEETSFLIKNFELK